MKASILALFATITLAPALAAAQETATVTTTTTTTAAAGDAAAPGPHEGWKGISLGFPSGGGPTVGGTYFVSDTLALKLDLGLDVGRSAADNKTFRFGASIEGGARIYIAKAGNLSPFVQPGLFLARPAAGGDFMDPVVIQANAGIGAEYFFNDHLSAAGLTGLGLRFSDNFDTIKLTSGTSALYVNLYW